MRCYGIPADQSPWSKHAWLSPTCAYVIKEKGEVFIKDLQTTKELALNSDYTVFTFIRKTCDTQFNVEQSDENGQKMYSAMVTKR